MEPLKTVRAMVRMMEHLRSELLTERETKQLLAPRKLGLKVHLRLESLKTDVARQRPVQTKEQLTAQRRQLKQEQNGPRTTQHVKLGQKQARLTQDEMMVVQLQTTELMGAKRLAPGRK